MAAEDETPRRRGAAAPHPHPGLHREAADVWKPVGDTRRAGPAGPSCGPRARPSQAGRAAISRNDYGGNPGTHGSQTVKSNLGAHESAFYHFCTFSSLLTLVCFIFPGDHLFHMLR